MPFSIRRTVKVAGKGSVVVPLMWSDNAATILLTKYCRSYNGLFKETSAMEVFERLTDFWLEIKKGELPNYWYVSPQTDPKAELAERFRLKAELLELLVEQKAAPNSPQFFNAGINNSYDILGSDIGLWHWNFQGAVPTQHTYTFPQLHACFLQPIEDSLSGITDLLATEARLFQRGSGTGTNFSTLRAAGERLAGGGTSSGVISFLKVFDAMAGAIKSGGTRRSAKMVILDIDHPDIEEFINWKWREEKKAYDLGSLGYGTNWEDESYQTVSGQNSNNSVRVSNDFMYAVREDEDWQLKGRVDDSVNRTVKAIDLWQQICKSAHGCADPGLIFSDTVNHWNTTPNSGEIRTCNPCAEHWRLDNSACNLASINIGKFVGKTDKLDIPAFGRAVELFIRVLDTSVDKAGYPSEEICETTHQFRDLGLGYANLGGVLMSLGLPYDSDKGRCFAASVTSLMTAIAYCTSAELAKEKGAYPAFAENREDHLRVLDAHIIHDNLLYIDITNAGADDYIVNEAERVWRQAERLTKKHGQRNAQTTVIAPTGTIALLMDCDTTGIEPAFALKSQKQVAKLSGGKGSTMTLTIDAVGKGLRTLGYQDGDILLAKKWINKHGNLQDCPLIGDDHKPVFHTAMHGLTPEAHIKMVGACQPFVAGGISKTINMPSNATVEDISKAYKLAHKLGLKCISIYRDGSKSQPLTADCKKCGDDEACEIE